MIDVIIPCFNAEKTLMRAVESVLGSLNLAHFGSLMMPQPTIRLLLQNNWHKLFQRKLKLNLYLKTGALLKRAIGGHYKAKQNLSPF